MEVEFRQNQSKYEKEESKKKNLKNKKKENGKLERPRQQLLTDGGGTSGA